MRSETYRESGVDIAEADAGLNRIIARVQKTWPAAGLGRLILPIGYFANVIELDGVGLALCTDGVGSKTIIADMMGKYDTIGIDCVAMAVGRVDLDKVIDGRAVREGDAVIGVKSSGIHSNGLSLARKAFFADHHYGISHKFEELAVTLGEELLRPTDIYVREALEIL